MNHNYKITDFKNHEITESDTDIRENNVTVYLRNTDDLPLVLEKRLEGIINNLIVEYEQESNAIIPLENMDLGICITIISDSKELLLEVFIGYDMSKESLHKEEVITATDKHYDIIRKFFFDKLNDYVSEQIRRIKGVEVTPELNTSPLGSDVIHEPFWQRDDD